MRRHTVRTQAPWEEQIGYSRLVKVGRQIHVTGTTALTSDGVLVGEGDPYAQALQCLRNIDAALAEAGSSLSDVVRTRMYVIDIARDWEQVGRAHRELLGTVMPATTMVEVSRLIDPRMLVEIEADAVVGAGLDAQLERPRIVDASFDPDSDLADMLRSVDLPLPTEKEGVTMLKAYVGGELVGCVGYEPHGDGAVLHSLVVIREAKGEGVGRALVDAVIDRLRQARVKRVYLVTADTSRYFAYLGFSPVDRGSIPAAVLDSPQLAEYDGDEATFMCREITEAG
ncbi:MAG: GNAT family N-acetyltransferase [Myxococcales bacterium]|jgi:enamine deaminase RidA (YjgF/YER057c/UK114 family)/N-acetylglutamate synthase-like GNAT family acetyltransferase